MTKFYNEILCKLETAIQELEIETDYSIQRIETVIDLIIKSLLELKQFVLQKDLRIRMMKSIFSNIKNQSLLPN